jgi:hypothetical protein
MQIGKRVALAIARSSWNGRLDGMRARGIE